MKVQIGVQHITAGEEFTLHSSYARWFDRIRVDTAQDVPVYAEVESGRVVDFPGAWWQIVGMIVASDWSPCYGGVPIADGRNKNLGQERTYVNSTYAHALAWSILKGEADGFALLPDFEARRVPFEYRGEKQETAGIFQREG